MMAQIQPDHLKNRGSGPVIEIHFLPPEAINIRFLSIQFITMLEPTFLPAELPIAT